VPYPTGTPVDEQILDDVKDALDAIATPSYHSTVRYVSRYDPENGINIPTGEYPALLIGPASIAWDDGVHALQSGVMTFTVRGFVEQFEQVATALAWLAADIRKALTADYTRGAVALSTRILEQTSWTLADAAGPIHGVDITVQVPFRHEYDNPNSPI
jgi:hypothetical protein